jgi:hypothetical protein
MTYSRRWGHFWCIIAAAGVGLATLEWSPLVAVMAVTMDSTFAAVGLIMLQTYRHQQNRVRASQWLRQIGPLSLLIGCGVVAASAITTASPPLALLTGLLVVMTSPIVVHRMWPGVPQSAPQRTNQREPRREPQAQDGISAGVPPQTDLNSPPEVSSRSVEDFNDRELFSLWRRTFWELKDQRAPTEVLRMVALRQSCLDELERRNPSALQAWLASGARASGGPERFWVARPHSGNADAAA